MNILDLAAAVLRRWYIVLLGIVAAGAVGYYLYQSQPGSFESFAAVSVVPQTGSSPEVAASDPSANPYLELDASVAQATSLVVAQVNAADAREIVAARTGGSYEATNVDLTPQTFTTTISITATATDPEAARATADAVIDEVRGTLAAMQNRAGVSPDAALRADPIVPPSEGTAAGSSRLRAAGAGAAAVLLLTLLITLTLDTVLRRRSPGPVTMPAADAEAADVVQDGRSASSNGADWTDQIPISADPAARPAPTAGALPERDRRAANPAQGAARSAPQDKGWVGRPTPPN